VRLACVLSGIDGRPPPGPTTIAMASHGSGWLLDGCGDFVVHADGADLLVVLAHGPDRDVQVLVVPANAAGVHVQPHVMLDLTRPMARVTFTRVAVGPEQRLALGGLQAVERALDRARIALASEAVGGAERLLEITTEYVKQRVQFGRPVGSFQSIKHRLADVMVQVEAAKSAAWYAACVVDEGGEELAEAAAVAKSYCCDAFYDCAATAIQLHGGIGFTWEHDAHLYFKRARATATLLGSPAWLRERLMVVLGCGSVAAPLF
jgi:alkylation response protein AidB-like acyl-CoA dehydrogenase